MNSSKANIGISIIVLIALITLFAVFSYVKADELGISIKAGGTLIYSEPGTMPLTAGIEYEKKFDKNIVSVSGDVFKFGNDVSVPVLVNYKRVVDSNGAKLGFGIGSFLDDKKGLAGSIMFEMPLYDNIFFETKLVRRWAEYGYPNGFVLCDVGYRF